MSDSVIQQAAVKRWGKSFHSIVWDLSHQGYSRNEASLILGYKSHSQFFRMCKNNKWDHWFLPAKATVGRARSVKNLRAMATDVEYRGIRASLYSHAKRLGIAPSTVFKRAKTRPGDLDYILSTKRHPMMVNKERREAA